MPERIAYVCVACLEKTGTATRVFLFSEGQRPPRCRLHNQAMKRQVNRPYRPKGKGNV